MNTLKRNLTKSKEFLQMNKAILDAEFGKLVGSGNVKSMDSPLYIKKEIGGASSIYELIDGTQNLSTGLTNIDKGRLPLGEAFVLEGIKIMYDTDALITDPSQVIAWSQVSSTFDAALLNAEIEITVAGVPIVRCPVEDCITQAAAIETDVYKVLDGRKLIPGGKEIRVNLILPVGESVSNTNEHHIYVKLIGNHFKAKL